MSPGGDFGVCKDLLTSPMGHLHWFKEMMLIMQMLLEGDIQTPNTVLQVEWFYMSFHCNDCADTSAADTSSATRICQLSRNILRAFSTRESATICSVNFAMNKSAQKHAASILTSYRLIIMKSSNA